MSAPTPLPRSSRVLSGLLGWIERVGNALPEPATLFALLALLVLLGSGIAEATGLAVIHPINGEPIRAVSLLNLEGFQRIIRECVTVFVTFRPLGIVLVCLLGIAVAEKAGLISAALRALVLNTPRTWVTAILLFVGVMSNLGADIGFVVVIPLGGMLFHAVGRNPLVGIAVAFAGVSAGFNANLLVSALDVILGALTTEAAHLIDPDYEVTGLANYYFLFVSTFLVVGLGTWVTHRWVEPRFGPYAGNVPKEPLTALTALEKRGLWWTAGFALLATAVLIAGVVPADGFLRNPDAPADPMRALPFAYLVPFIFVLSIGCGLTFGLAARTIRSDRDVISAMNDSMATMGSYLVIAFFAAQFIAFFSWTHLGAILAIKGATALQALGLDDWPIPLMLGFVLLAAGINLLIGSASAKWALISPVFVPMFMLMGFSPELVQAAYRVGDSISNIITPLLPYFPLVIIFMRKYAPETGIGTLVATMLPYSVVLFLGWALLLVAWMLFGLPLGPNAPLYL